MKVMFAVAVCCAMNPPPPWTATVSWRPLISVPLVLRVTDLSQILQPQHHRQQLEHVLGDSRCCAGVEWKKGSMKERVVYGLWVEISQQGLIF